MKAKIPFLPGEAIIGTGDRAASFAGLLDKAQNKLGRVPGVGTLGSWFDRRVDRAISPRPSGRSGSSAIRPGKGPRHSIAPRIWT